MADWARWPIADHIQGVSAGKITEVMKIRLTYYVNRGYTGGHIMSSNSGRRVNSQAKHHKKGRIVWKIL